MVDPTYEALFLAHLQRALLYAWELVENREQTSLDNETVAYVLHTLSFSMDTPIGWEQTRQILLHLRPLMERLGRCEEWSAYVLRGIEAGIRSGDAETVAMLQYEMGMVYFVLGQGEGALHYFRDSHTYFAQFQDIEAMARALNGCARVAHSRGHLQEAIGYTYQALTLLGDAPVAERATGYRLLGTIAFSEREWEKALTFFQRDLAIWQAQKAAHRIAFGLVNIGSALRALERYNDATVAYQEALLLFEKEEDPVHVAATQMNLGNVYLKQKRYEEAQKMYFAADWQLREANEATRLAMLYNNIGMAYAGLQQWEQAENFYRDSIQRWQQLNNDRSCVNTMDNLGELYLQWHQKERALAILAEAYEIALTLDDRHLRQLVAEHLDRARKL